MLFLQSCGSAGFKLFRARRHAFYSSFGFLCMIACYCFFLFVYKYIVSEAIFHLAIVVQHREDAALGGTGLKRRLINI